MKMYSVKDISLRFFKRNKVISCSSVLSVALSVFVIITLVLFLFNAEQSLRNDAKKIYGDMDLSVSYAPESHQKMITKPFLEQIKSDPSVQSYSGVLVSKSNIGPYESIYTVGVDSNELSKSRYHFTNTIHQQEVILNQGLAEALIASVRDTVFVEQKPFTVVQIIPDVNAGGTPSDIAVMDRNDLKHLLTGKSGDAEATQVLIKTKKGVEPAAFADELSRWEQGLRIELTSDNGFLTLNLKLLKPYVYTLSFLTLSIISLLIIASFQTFLYKYKTQFAIMRTIGARTSDMFKIIFIQCSIMNMAGGVIGYLLALSMSKMVKQWLEYAFNTPLSTFEFNFWIALAAAAVSLCIIELFMLIPAYKASKTLPMHIMQTNEKKDFQHKKGQSKAGKVFLAASLALLLLTFTIVAEMNRPLTSLFAIFLFMIGAFLLLPFYMTTFLIKILPTVRKLWGNTSYVAVKNLIPQVKKNTFIMLTIGSLIILAMLGSTLLKTVKFNGDEYLKAQYPTNIVISARETTSNALNHSAVIEEIKKIQGVTFASRLLNGSGSVSIKQHDKDFGFAYALADLNEMIDQGLIQGSTGPISQSDDVYVTKRFADKYHLHIGEIFEIGLYSDEAQATLPAGTRTVAGIMPTLPGGYADVYMDWQTSGLVNGPGSLQKIFVSADRDSEQLYQELTQLKKQFPALQVNTYEKALQENEMMFVQRWAIFIIVNLVILCSVIIGIMSVLANYIYSKRKEFAIIRTFFVTPYGVLKMIITQVFLYLLVGILTGIVIGLIVTRSIFLIDTAAAIHFDFGLPVLMILLLITISLAVFLPYGIYMSKRNLADELLQE